jgi:hypothetical protein
MAAKAFRLFQRGVGSFLPEGTGLHWSAPKPKQSPGDQRSQNEVQQAGNNYCRNCCNPGLEKNEGPGVETDVDVCQDDACLGIGIILLKRTPAVRTGASVLAYVLGRLRAFYE